MKKAKFILILAVAALITTGAAWAGDSCNAATSILPGVTSDQLTSGSRWFGFQAGQAGAIPFNTSLPGTTFRTKLAIYSSCGGSPIATSEGSAERNAYLNLEAAFAGQQFYVEVSSLAGGSGAFDLAVALVQGGCPGAGDCFSDNGTPGCDDTCSAAPCGGCCATVCAVDSFCCDTSWDGICAGEAMSLCVVVPVDLKNFQIDG